MQILTKRTTACYGYADDNHLRLLQSGRSSRACILVERMGAHGQANGIVASSWSCGAVSVLCSGIPYSSRFAASACGHAALRGAKQYLTGDVALSGTQDFRRESIRGDGAR